MSKAIDCPLCSGQAAKVIDSVKWSAITSGYFRAFKIELNRLLGDQLAEIQLLRCDTCDLLWYSPGVAGDQRLYEELQMLPWYYQSEKPEYEFARKQVRDGDRVLEIGCGKGAFISTLPKSAACRGLEFNDAAVATCKAQGLDVEAQSVAIEADMRPGYYDVVCNFQVLEHVSDPWKFLQDCVRCLRPGGKLVVAVPAEDSFLSLVEDGWLNMPPHHLTRWTDRCLEFAVAQLEMKIQAKWHEPVAEYHQGWYRDVMRNAGLKRMLGTRIRLVAGRWWSAFERRVGRIQKLMDRLVAVGEESFPRNRDGHSVCIVATKELSGSTVSAN